MREITEFIKTGNITSFEKIFRFYSPRLRKYALHFLNDEEEVNDLIQDVFVQLWTKRKDLNDEKNVESLLFTVIRNKCLNLIKKSIVEEKFIERQTHLESERLYFLSFNDPDEYKSMQDQLNTELKKAMDSMSERCRTAFHLRWIEGKKQREISEIMDISMTMVNKHLTKGLEITREFVKPEHFILFFLFKY